MKEPREIIKKTQEDYNIIASHFGQTRRVLWQDLAPFLAEVKKGENILDLGCGNGRIFLALEDKKIDYTGVDFSEELIAQAQKRFPQARFIATASRRKPRRFAAGMSRSSSEAGVAMQTARLTGQPRSTVAHEETPTLRRGVFILADLTEKSLWKELREKKFDKVFLIAVLHHFPTPLLQRQLLKRINKVLKKNGSLFLTVWNLYQIKFWKKHLKQLAKKITAGFKFKWLWVPYRLSDGREIKREIYRFCYGFTQGELESLLKKVGFRISKIYYSKKGKKTDWFRGFNLCAEAKKMVK